VSSAERYARIIADEGIAHKVRGLEWQAAIDALNPHMRDGHTPRHLSQPSSAVQQSSQRMLRLTVRSTSYQAAFM
jgi:uncharacterized membrane protein